ncbi:hypothetical protein PHYPO_G00019150 [Pangasianodon hypophthalmus]|uniref:Uncharacterized protein n=1 Tax=Pangasianodon hypophthalmus TaxID=310915 RepID=A0A5N5N5T8_PANHP|nr:hypothetical protein PHYPO_G00019150 [Pangasianodon hypophthalmus]
MILTRMSSCFLHSRLQVNLVDVSARCSLVLLVAAETDNFQKLQHSSRGEVSSPINPLLHYSKEAQAFLISRGSQAVSSWQAFKMA